MSTIRKLGGVKPARGKHAGGKPTADKRSDAKPTGAKPASGPRTSARRADAKPTDAKPASGPRTSARRSDAKPTDAKPSAHPPARRRRTSDVRVTEKPTSSTLAGGKPTGRQATAGQRADSTPTSSASGVPRGRREQGRRAVDATRPQAAAPTPRDSEADTFIEAPRKVPAQLTGYLAPPGLEAEVLREVGPVWHQHGRLLLCAGPPRPSVWAQDVWLAPQHRAITSIGDAANALRAVQRNWVPLVETQHRRIALIASKLPPMKARTWPFPTALPDAALGAYTLLSHDRMLFSASRRSPFPHGEVDFAEDHDGPPSRAYRKLWEAFTLLQQHPQPNERCIDMGASPGGWTWVLARLGARVTSVDKAPLAPDIAALPNVTSLLGSAFAVRPESYADQPFDWFFSDVICYPARLLTMVQQWMAAGAAKRFVCTLKFQGETDHDTVAAFAAIPGSQLLHLAHNRHELTWVKL